MPQLESPGQDVVEGDQNRQLQQHREAAAHRVVALSLIELHQLFVHFLALRRVAFRLLVLIPDRVHFRRELLHFLHRGVALPEQRKKKNAQEQRDEKNRDAVIAAPGVRPFQEPEQRPRENAKPAEIDCSLKPRVHALQSRDVLRAEVGLSFKIARAADPGGDQRSGLSGGILEWHRLGFGRRGFFRDKDRKEVVVLKSRKAAFGERPDRRLVELVGARTHKAVSQARHSRRGRDISRRRFGIGRVAQSCPNHQEISRTDYGDLYVKNVARVELNFFFHGNLIVRVSQMQDSVAFLLDREKGSGQTLGQLGVARNLYVERPWSRAWCSSNELQRLVLFVPMTHQQPGSQDTSPIGDGGSDKAVLE